MRRVSAPAGALILALCVAGAPLARAESVSDIGRKLDALAAEVNQLTSSVGRVSAMTRATRRDSIGRRIIDAQSYFASGNYDDAALMLYEIVERFPKHPGTDAALYYLAESLFQKGDTLAAKEFFTRLATERGSKSKFYRQSLERLIELTLLLGDGSGADTWLKALDKVPAGEQQSSVPYVRGKYYYQRKQYDTAIRHFTRVAAKSPYYFQARYFLGVAQTAKGQLPRAIKTFQALVDRKGKTDEEKRIVELSHLAIGRLHYERDSPSRAIDSYLNIDRHSDLFPEALFEASWVYVKNKEYDKALRALELLALSDPNSYRMPEVRILEANLRIRRAKKLERDGGGNPAEEYARAQKLFEETRGAFKKPHEALAKIVAEDDDPKQYLEQITGRETDAFQTRAPLPEVAASWLRQEPEVKRFVGVESDIAAIEGEIDQAEMLIDRLERAIRAPTRMSFFPALASKRVRGTEILEQVLKLRARLASAAARQVRASASDRAELGRLAANRRAVERQLASLPGAQKSYSARVASARGAYVKVDKRRSEVSAQVQFLEAQLVAIERYVASGAAIPEARRGEIEREMNGLRAEIDTLRGELDTLSRDITSAADTAGSGDALARREAELRGQLRAALDAESRLLSRLSTSGPAKSAIAEMQKANRVTGSIDRLFSKIDGSVDKALAEVKSDLADEKVKLAAYKQELENYEAESAAIGAELVGSSFKTVAKKFYEIIVRTDVGVVDVAWSKQEEADNRFNRLTMDQAREMRTLQSDFADVLREREKQKNKETSP